MSLDKQHDINAQKKVLRNKMLLMRKQLEINYKNAYDLKICDSLWEIIALNNFSVIHAYIPFKEEINITPLLKKLLQNNLKVVCPKTLTNRKLENRVLHSLENLEEGIMKTLHPKNAEIYNGNYDMIIVPGLAFNIEGYRLGYGGGYYDTFLSENKNALSVGVFYPFQNTESLPLEMHDFKLNRIISF